MKIGILTVFSFILLKIMAMECEKASAVSPEGTVQACSGDFFNPITAAKDEVLVTVGGMPITCGEWQARLDLEKNIFRYRRRKSRKTREAFERELLGFAQTRVAQIMPTLINQILIKAAMKAEGITLDEGVVSNVLVQSCSSFGVRKGGSEALARALSVDAAYLKDQLLDPVRVKVMREHFDPSSRTVSEKEIDEGLERQTRYYERAIASNAVTYVTCSNVLNKVLGGKMDFKVAAHRYSADPDSADEGEEFDLEDFETDVKALKPHMAKLKKWAFTAPIGSVSGPWEMEDGLSIVKILSREGGTLNRSVVSLEDEAEVTLARITFEMVEPEPEPRTREFVRESLLKWKADQAQKAMFKKLHDEMKLVYPHGKKIVYKFADQSVKEK